MMKLLKHAIMILVLYSSFSIWAQATPENQLSSYIDWNPSGQTIAVSDGNSTVKIIDANTLAVLNVLPIFPNTISAIRWNDNGTKLAIAGQWSIQIWSNPDNSQLATLSLSLETPVQIMPFGVISLDWNDISNEILAVASARGFVWQSQTGQLLRTLEPYTTPIVSGLWSNDGARLAWGDSTGYVLVQELITQENGGGDTIDFDAVSSLAWSPDGNILAAGTNSGVIQIFSERGKAFQVNGPALISEFPVLSLDWNPTRNLLAVGRSNGNVEIWNMSSRTKISSVSTEQPVVSVVWNPQGTKLAYNNGITLATVIAPIEPTPTPSPTPTITPTPTPAVVCNTTVASGNNAALITAIQSGNSAGSPYVICLGNGTFTLTASNNTLDGGNGLPQITGNVTLYGTGAVIERQSAAPAFRLLRINAGARLKLEGVTVRGGAAGTSSGGGVRNLGTLELVNAIIENNTGANGAGIQNNVNATLTATNSTIRTNTVTTNGGGLLSNTGSSTTLTNTTFTGNVTSTASGLGGGLFMTGATLNINGGTFSTNQARNGGAIFVNSSTSATITGTTFTGNTAALNGGGMYVNANTVSINDATFTSNTAQANGGAIQTTTGTTLNLTNVDVLNNSAVSVGGGLMSDGAFSITGSIFTGNNAGVRGGGISAANGTNRIVQNSCLSANTSPAAREVTNDGTAALNATSNYWGAATGAVSGQVSANVNTGSFLGSCGS